MVANVITVSGTQMAPMARPCKAALAINVMGWTLKSICISQAPATNSMPKPVIMLRRGSMRLAKPAMRKPMQPPTPRLATISPTIDSGK